MLFRSLGIEPVSSTDPRGNSKVKLDLEGTAGPLRTKIGAEAAGDLGALTLPVFRLDGQISATDGAALVGLLGLDRALAVDRRAGTLSVSVRAPRAATRASMRASTQADSPPVPTVPRGCSTRTGSRLRSM